jgi:hypothetical protein
MLLRVASDPHNPLPLVVSNLEKVKYTHDLIKVGPDSTVCKSTNALPVEAGSLCQLVSRIAITFTKPGEFIG